MKFSGLALIPVLVDIPDEDVPKDPARALKMAERGMRVACERIGLEPRQISSVKCLDNPPKPDGTNGPVVTLTETVASEAPTLDGTRVVK